MKRKNEQRCDFCGLVENDMHQNGWFGCARCHKIFTVKPATFCDWAQAPKGETAADENSQHIHIGILREEMHRAIHMEEYELAASLRDQLRESQSRPEVAET